jgi:hypothetical protein
VKFRLEYKKKGGKTRRKPRRKNKIFPVQSEEQVLSWIKQKANTRQKAI